MHRKQRRLYREARAAFSRVSLMAPSCVLRCLIPAKGLMGTVCVWFPAFGCLYGFMQAPPPPRYRTVPSPIALLMPSQHSRPPPHTTPTSAEQQSALQLYTVVTSRTLESGITQHVTFSDLLAFFIRFSKSLHRSTLFLLTSLSYSPKL